MISDQVKGVAAMVGACTIWGLSGLYYRLLTHVPPLEVLGHRTVWSLVFLMTILTVQRRPSAALQALRDRSNLWVIALAALAISVNWLVFITSIGIDKAVEASLGYYIFPLMTVVFGAVIYGERLRSVQWAAVALATVAVCVLAIGLQVAPWIALILATSFAFYGVLKKRLPVGPVVSVTAEVTVLAPLGLIGLIWWQTTGQGAFGRSVSDTALLMFSGVMTGVPLILFSTAARHVPLSTIGILQYINPTLQFFVAVWAFGEAFTLWHAIAFALIWGALVMFSGSALAQDRARRRVASAASAVSVNTTRS